MMIASLTYTYIFLPLMVAVMALTPRALRPCVLLVISLFLYFLAEPGYLPLLIAQLLTDYLAMRLMERYDSEESRRRLCFRAAMLKDLGLIALISSRVQIAEIPPPLGYIIYTLTSLSCLIDIYKREAPYERNLLDFGLMCAFFPKLYAGPLVAHSQLMPFIKEMKKPAEPKTPLFDLEALIGGGSQIVFGLAKVVILGDSIQQVFESLKALPAGQITVLSSWSMIACLAFSLYFRLLGYCDIAVGLGGILGLPLPENFRHPYQASSLEDFFQRFNSSVSAFIQKYVYINLDEDRNGVFADSINLLIVGMLQGLYFGFRINYLVWGAYLALFIILERYVLKEILRRIPVFFRRIGTFCVVLTSFAIFSGESLSQTGMIVRQMLNLRPGLSAFNNATLYILSSNWFLILLCAFFSLGLMDGLFRLLKDKSPILYNGIIALSAGGVLILTTAFML